MSDVPTITVDASSDVIAAAPIDPQFGSFSSGVAVTFATRLLMLAGTVGASIVVARCLGPAGVGMLAVLSTTVALALQIGSAGLPSANTYFISQDRSRLGPVWANALAFGLAAGIALAAAVIVLRWTNPALLSDVPLLLLTMAAISIPFQLLILLGLNILLAVDRIRQMNLLESLSPVMLLLNALVVLFLLRRGLSTLVAFNTAATIALAFILTWMIFRSPRREVRMPFKPNFLLLRKMLSYGLKFYISIMAGAVILRADLLIVNHFRGAGEAGVYSVASQISFLLLMLPGVIATLLFPRVAAANDAHGEFAVKVTRQASLVTLIACLAAACGSFTLPLIYGARFTDATIQLLILLPGVYLIGIESVLVQHFTGTGLPAAIPGFWLITVAASIGLNLILVPIMGARGAALTSTLSYALIFGLVAFYFCGKTKRRLREIFLPRRSDLREMLTLARALSTRR